MPSQANQADGGAPDPFFEDPAPWPRNSRRKSGRGSPTSPASKGLQLGDFDLYRKTIVVTGKGSKRRLIPVSTELAATVDEYMLTEYPLLGRLPVATDFLWYGVFRVGERVIGLKPERCLSYRGFYEWWKRVEATAGVRHRKPHMTRQTFATDVLDATEGDLYAVKELLGHSSTRVTEV